MLRPTDFRALIFGSCLLALCSLSLSCGTLSTRERPTEKPSPSPLVEVEPVDDELRRHIDLLLETDDTEAMAQLAADLVPGVRLLALMRSPRAASLARELQRLSPDENLPPDTWGGPPLVRWASALQQWERNGTPDLHAFSDLPCDPPELHALEDASNDTLPPWQYAAQTLRTKHDEAAHGGAAPSNHENDTAANAHPSPDDASSGDGDAYEDEDLPPQTDAVEAPLLAPEQSADISEYGVCILRHIQTAFDTADAGFTTLQRASLGNLKDTAHHWLQGRALPIDNRELLGAADVRLRSARAWTRLPASTEPFLAQGLVVALRSTGISVSYRPAITGAAALGVPSPASSAACLWPSEEFFSFSAGGDRDLSTQTLEDGLTALTQRITQCEQSPFAGVREGTHVLVDAGLQWRSLAPVLRQLLAIQRPPTLLVHEARSGTLSALPTDLATDVPGILCGVEAHLRRDGVVLRGGGASVSLHSWSDAETFEALTHAATAAAERCEEPANIRVFVDEPTVDWGIIVRVIERMSWPQSCEDQPCLRTTLVVENSR